MRSLLHWEEGGLAAVAAGAGVGAGVGLVCGAPTMLRGLAQPPGPGPHLATPGKGQTLDGRGGGRGRGRGGGSGRGGGGDRGKAQLLLPLPVHLLLLISQRGPLDLVIPVWQPQPQGLWGLLLLLPLSSLAEQEL